MKQTTTVIRLTVTLLCATTLNSACSMSGDEDPPTPTGRLIVANGGNFADQNGSLSRIDLETGQIHAGPTLDGFVQGLEPIGNEIAVLVNTFGDGRVDFVDPATLTPDRSLTGIDSPRDAVEHGDLLFVSVFAPDGSGRVHAVDPMSASVSRSWSVGGEYPEGIAAMAGRVFVAQYGFLGAGNALTVVEPDGGEDVGTVKLGCDGPRDLLPAGEDLLLVVCQGKTVYDAEFTEILEQTPGQIVFVDALTLAVVGRLVLEGQPAGSNGTQGSTLVPGLGSAFLLDPARDRVLAIDTAARTAASVIVDWPGTGVGLSGIAFDGRSGRLLAGRLARGIGGAPDYTAAGSVVAFEVDGTRGPVYTVGQAPTHLLVLP